MTRWRNPTKLGIFSIFAPLGSEVIFHSHWHKKFRPRREFFKKANLSVFDKICITIWSISVSNMALDFVSFALSKWEIISKTSQTLCSSNKQPCPRIRKAALLSIWEGDCRLNQPMVAALKCGHSPRPPLFYSPSRGLKVTIDKRWNSMSCSPPM